MFSFSATYEELQDLPKPGNGYFTKPGRSDETPHRNQAPVLFVLQNTYLPFHISPFLYFFFFTIKEWHTEDTKDLLHHSSSSSSL